MFSQREYSCKLVVLLISSYLYNYGDRIYLYSMHPMQRYKLYLVIHTLNIITILTTSPDILFFSKTEFQSRKIDK